MGRKTVLLCISLLFIAQAAYPAGQRFLEEAIFEMEKAFAEAETDFTPQDEYYLGRAVAANILARYRLYTGNPELASYLNMICMAIAINSSRPEIYNGYRVIILDSPEYNAFATPGGHILITKALIEAAPSEDALASIIAHELAHIQLRHGMDAVNNIRVNDSMAAAAGRAADYAARESADAKRGAEFRNSITAYIDMMLQSGYSQVQEFEADREAILLLAGAGYDPAALIEMLNVLGQGQGGRRGGFYSSHPSPAQRIANTEGIIWRYPVRNTRAYRAPRFERYFSSREKL